MNKNLSGNLNSRAQAGNFHIMLPCLSSAAAQPRITQPLASPNHLPAWAHGRYNSSNVHACASALQIRGQNDWQVRERGNRTCVWMQEMPVAQVVLLP